MLFRPPGLFSLNITVPHNGSRNDVTLADGTVIPAHSLADGTIAGYSGFYAVIGGVVCVMLCTWLIIWLIFKTSGKRVRPRAVVDRPRFL